MTPVALIVAGPTASGKSALALALAERIGGTVINADSMQVYRELRILTARPTPAEEATVPHALYGVRPAREPGSAAWWRDAALAAMDAARAAGRVPLLCGGTGLYFSSLIDGLSPIPPVSDAARQAARALLKSIGPAALHARLAAVDPATAARLRPTDSQRVARAWEVWCSSGRGLASWQSEQAAPPASSFPMPPRSPAASGSPAAPGSPAASRSPEAFRAVLLDPPREVLREAIERRFGAMLAAGAMAEVQALLDHGLDPALPAMRAHGVPELAAHLRGEISIEEAARRARLVTGQYAKRQATWFRHHALAEPGAVHMIHARFTGLTQFSERERGELLNFIDAPA
jgi:tRNA dimethylallyltransferase